MPNLSQSPDIGQNSDGGISDFLISGQSLIKENCHNSRTSHDIVMKLGPVTKLEKRNKTSLKKVDVDVMSKNYDVIVIFRIFGQFGAVPRPDSRHRVCKCYVFSNINLLTYKTENRAKKSLTKISHYCFEERYFFEQKPLIFCKKMLTSAKLGGPRH